MAQVTASGRDAAHARSARGPLLPARSFPPAGTRKGPSVPLRGGLRGEAGRRRGVSGLPCPAKQRAVCSGPRALAERRPAAPAPAPRASHWGTVPAAQAGVVASAAAGRAGGRCLQDGDVYFGQNSSAFTCFPFRVRDKTSPIERQKESRPSLFWFESGVGGWGPAVGTAWAC